MTDPISYKLVLFFLTITALSGVGCADSDCPEGMVDNGRGRCVLSESADAAVADASVLGVSQISATDWTTLPDELDAGKVDDRNPPVLLPAMACDGDSCGEDAPICEPDAGICVECLTNDDCPNAPEDMCIDHVCGPCRDNGDCTDPAAARCELDSGQCTTCADDSDCAGVIEDGRVLGICTEAGACVECTGGRDEACGQSDSGQPYVCDTAAQRCSAATAGQASICGDCLSDPHCPAGTRCVREEVADQQLGFVCLPFLGEGGQTDCLGNGRPYVTTRTRVESIDGVTTDVCGLRLSSCKAQREHSAPVQDCMADHASVACGEPDVEDALCRSPQGETAYRCVMLCASSDDCKLGFACNDQQPAFCDFAPNTCYADTDCEKPATCDLASHRCR